MTDRNFTQTRLAYEENELIHKMQKAFAIKIKPENTPIVLQMTGKSALQNKPRLFLEVNSRAP